MTTKLTAPRTATAIVCFALSPLFLGIALAWATFFAMYPTAGDAMRPVVASGVLLLIILLGWFLIPANRPQPGALAIQVVVVWALVLGASIVRARLHGEPLRVGEWGALIICTAVFVFGIYVSHRTRWGRKAFVHSRPPWRAAKKPVAFLWIILPTLLGGFLAVVTGLIYAYAKLNGIPRSAIPDLNGLLITLPALVLWIPIALILSNLALHAVPVLRQRAEQYASESGHPGFMESQRQLSVAALIAAAVCVPLLILGFML